MNAQLKPEVTPGLCCCHWDFTRWVRLYTDPTCSVHGVAAMEIDRQRAIEDRETARQEDREFNACESATNWEA